MAFNINNFVKNSKDFKDPTLESNMVVVQETIDTTKSRKRKKNEIAPVQAAPPVPATSMSYVQENIPYASAYAETNKQLDDSIAQLNMLGMETLAELNLVRASKIRNRHNIIRDMTENATSIINAKLSAIKEKNNTINQINKLELDRLKQLKITASEEDDNTKIANLYNAFVNTPIGAGPGVLGPSMQEIIMNQPSGNAIPVTQIGDDQQMWEAGLSPAQNRMLLDAKGVIETIVMYDEATGNRWFEVVDKNTRQPVPNVEKPDNTNIYDLDINIRGNFAKDSNRGVVYPLVVINGGDQSIMQY